MVRFIGLPPPESVLVSVRIEVRQRSLGTDVFMNPTDKSSGPASMALRSWLLTLTRQLLIIRFDAVAELLALRRHRHEVLQALFERTGPMPGGIDVGSADPLIGR